MISVGKHRLLTMILSTKDGHLRAREGRFF
jgi:hypothetical protein